MTIFCFHKWESLETMFNNYLFSKNLMKACLAAVFAVGLAACSSSDTAIAPPGPTQEQQELTALQNQIAALRQQLGIDDTADIGNTIEELQATLATLKALNDAASPKAAAADAVTAAIAAGMKADQAKMDAAKYAGMLTTRAVDGDSAMAVMNAQMVLDAERSANAAVMAAGDALQAAMAAKTSAEALPADDPDRRANAIDAAERAVEVATAQKKAAMAIVDEAVGTDGSLKASLAMVRGFPLADDYPMTPADRGEAVAANVMTALATNAAAGAAGAPDGAIMHDSAAIGAMTWAQVAGEDNVMTFRRLDPTNSAIRQVQAKAVPGKTRGFFSWAAGGGPTLASTINDGTTYVGASYMGVPGAVFCGGNDCKVEGEDGDNLALVGSWYFFPADANALYVMGAGGSYEVATMYARYGAWLTYDDATDASGATRHAASGANTANLALGQAGDPLADVTARYSGKAAGVSAYNKTSGRFTADVNLTAKFAATPTLRGRISNFQGGAVGNWSVTLSETDLTTAAALDTGSGATAGGGEPGVWTAQGYGPAPINHDGDDGTTPAIPQRPAGFFGTFNADFGDGMAVGGYATRKVE